MKILLIGSGGREHALALALRRDPAVTELLIAPGNPGTAVLGENIDVDILDGGAIVELAQDQDVDLVVVGPEAPLVAGIADEVRAAGIAVFGPGQEAARLEGSKAFAKEIMAVADVPTAMARVCTTADQVEDALDTFGPPFVVKDDGLAAGKGVVVTSDRSQALSHAHACLAKDEGDRTTKGQPAVVIEEYLDGPELSLFCVCDGKNVVPLMPAQDFKRAFDGNEGPNTGGMGSYAPLPWIPDGLVDEVVARVAQPVVDEMAHRGTPFIGLLYCGLALTSRGLRVVEFNVRFGDPETQVVLPLLKTPLGTLLMSAAQGRLSGSPLRWSDGAAVDVVLAAHGYPGKVRTGDTVRGLDAAAQVPGVDIIHAGTAVRQDHVVSAGGRVLAVVASADSPEAAREAVYQAVERIVLEGSHYRTDIGGQGIATQ
ncbi:MAG: phosphoribosylamine--glycine ligase [Ancrocorticia sp.]|uniref:phosphoribosylamine--glycine ligase n=1 Tax=Ancrocorticia sp. TaxID=2593684 RepID=UPI003F8E30E9